MPDKRREYDKELEAIMKGLADSVIKEPAEELTNDLRAEGIDPEAYAEETRQLMLDAIKAHRQQHLRQARRSYEDSVAALKQKTYHLPVTAAKRRTLFDRALTKDPSLRQLTLQNRDFTELTDEDVESCLRQLQDLGVIDEQDLKDE